MARLENEYRYFKTHKRVPFHTHIPKFRINRSSENLAQQLISANCDCFRFKGDDFNGWSYNRCSTDVLPRWHHIQCTPRCLTCRHWTALGAFHWHLSKLYNYLNTEFSRKMWFFITCRQCCSWQGSVSEFQRLQRAASGLVRYWRQPMSI